jgi:hypothetical protein
MPGIFFIFVVRENFDPGAGSALDLATRAASDYFRGIGPLPTL